MMKLFNSDNRFGLMMRGQHWLWALAIIGLFGSGWYMVDLTYYDSLYNTLPDIHKAVGVLLIPLFVLRIVWRFIDRRPAPIETQQAWEHLAATAAHWMMYLLIVVILVTGYLIPTAAGQGISIFGLFESPAIITDLPRQQDIAGWIHEYGAYALIALVALHGLAALKHHFLDKDDTLSRML